MSALLACVLTILLETPLFAAAGYRDRTSLTVVVSVNAVTNLLLNAALPFLPRGLATAALGEGMVVAAEYTAYALAFGPSRRLLLLTALANAFSCGVGLLLWHTLGR